MNADYDLSRIAQWNPGPHCRQLQKVFLRSGLMPTQLHRQIVALGGKRGATLSPQTIYQTLVHAKTTNPTGVALDLIASALGVQPVYVTAREYVALREALDQPRGCPIDRLMPSKKAGDCPYGPTISPDKVSFFPPPPPPPSVEMASSFDLSRIAAWNTSSLHGRALQKVYLRTRCRPLHFANICRSVARRHNHGFTRTLVYQLLINGSSENFKAHSLEHIAETMGAIPIYLSDEQIERTRELMFLVCGLDYVLLDQHKPAGIEKRHAKHEHLANLALDILRHRCARMETQIATTRRQYEIARRRLAIRQIILPELPEETEAIEALTEAITRGGLDAFRVEESVADEAGDTAPLSALATVEQAIASEDAAYRTQTEAEPHRNDAQDAATDNAS